MACRCSRHSAIRTGNRFGNLCFHRLHPDCLHRHEIPSGTCRQSGGQTHIRSLAFAGVELQLAADILNTTVDPDIEGLVKLFGIALIRTFLNYFLTREIDIQEKYLSGQKTEQNLS
jgi:hypothetical protein